jgi:hypothetical protein
MSKKSTVAIEATTNEEVIINPMTAEVEAVVSSDISKSAKIRKLWVLFGSDNKARSMVAKTLGIRYQHVRNVLITPIKKA